MALVHGREIVRKKLNGTLRSGIELFGLQRTNMGAIIFVCKAGINHAVERTAD